MTQAAGAKAELVLAYETAYGANPSPVAGFGAMPFNSLDLAESRNVTAPGTITGVLSPVQPIVGNMDVRGNATIPVDLLAFGYWLKAMLGSAVSVVTGSVAAASVTVDADTDVIAHTTHGMLDGQGVILGGTAVPGGTVAGTVYYLRDKSTSAYKLCATPGGAAINFSNAGTSVTVTTVAAHVFKLSAAMPSLVLEKAFTDVAQYFLYNGIKIASLTLEVGGDGELTAAIAFVGASVANAQTRYDGSKTAPGFLRIGHFQAALQEGGATFAKATRWRLQVDFDLDTETRCIAANGVRGSLPQGVAKITGSLSTLFEDVTIWTKASAVTESSLKIVLTSGSYYLELLLPEITYGLKSPAVPGPKGVIADFDFAAHYTNADAATALQVTLVNSKVTAY